MMTLPTLPKEKCSCCLKCISIGQAITECGKCSNIIHTKCFKSSEYSAINNSFYCNVCKVDIMTRYNPFKLIEQRIDDSNANDDADYDYDEISTASSVLENCRAFTVSEFNNLEKKLFKDNVSTFFLNIDGNHTNFDNLLLELSKYEHEFSIIGLAETNIDENVGDVYQIPGYCGFYQNTLTGKSSGTGISLYIQDAYNATINRSLSNVTKNLETLFVTISHDNGPLHIGVVYRPPSGNKNDAIRELEAILENCPEKSVHILGDYNIDLHEFGNPLTKQFEDLTFSSGFYPTISLYTHQKSEHFKKSCIDNILTNDIDSIVHSGTISNRIAHHFPIFQLLNVSVLKKKNEKHVQHYDYCNSNLTNFGNELDVEFRQNPPKEFSAFETQISQI